MTDENDQLLKGNEVAVRLNISRSLAYRLMESNKIPTIRFGGSVRVLQGDLDEFIFAHRNVATNDLDRD